MNLERRIACVTGGANGLGLGVARALTECGALVHALDVDRASLDALPSDIIAVEVDLRSTADVQQAISDVVNHSGRIDVLVNSAGVIMSAPMINVLNPEQLMHDADTFERCIRDNLLTTFVATSAVVEQMVRKRTRGVVINISSISARGNPGQTAYSAAKAGINAMTVVWAREWGPFRIRCNAVAPGFVDSQSTRNALSEAAIATVVKNTPAGRLGDATEIADAVLFLIGNDFMNGAVLEVNGGLSL